MTKFKNNQYKSQISTDNPLPPPIYKVKESHKKQTVFFKFSNTHFLYLQVNQRKETKIFTKIC